MLLPLIYIAVLGGGYYLWHAKRPKPISGAELDAIRTDMKTAYLAKTAGPLGSTTHAAVRNGDLRAAAHAAQIVASQGAPPLDSAGYMGHTDILGAKFWGLPMDVIWDVEYAFANGDPKVIAFAAKKVAKYPKFRALAAEIAQAAKDRT